MIIVKDISKSFGSIKAVEDLSFKIDTGEVVGLLGPNGAGKTTTMRMLTGYLYSDTGKILVNGKNIQKAPEDIRQKIGYMPENNPIYKDMLVKELLDHVLELRQIPKEERDKLIDKVVESTGIKNVFYRQIGELSKGFKQRVGLAQALIHDPEILILDEPTEGLDVNQRAEIRKLIKEIGKEKTVIISTHVMQEVSAMCDRVLIINEGEVVADQKTSELGSNTTRAVVELDAKNAEKKLESMKTVKSVETGDKRSKKISYTIKYTNDDFFKELSNLTAKNKWTTFQLTVEQSSLEEIFQELTKKTK